MTKLKVGIHLNTVSINDKAKRELYKSFAKGITSSGEGDDVIIIDKKYNIQDLKDCDVAVIWGAVRNHKGVQKEMALKQQIITKYKKKGLIVLDNPVVCRTIDYKRNMPSVQKPTGTEYVRIGVDSFLADEGNFNNKEIKSHDRWNSFGIVPSAWRTTGSHILIILQKLFDASLGGIEEERPAANIKWLYDTITGLRKYTNRKIIIRCHPLSKHDKKEMVFLNSISLDKFENVSFDVNRCHPNIAHDLTDCWAVVTFSSGSCYDALIRGIPVITCNKGSLAWDITEHTFEKIESLPLPDLSNWLSKLSYVEWNISEIKAGLPWKHLKPIILKQLKK